MTPRFIKADVLSPESLVEGKMLPHSEYDVILSNPPYVKESEKEAMRINVLDHEPHLALFVPDDDALKFYRAVASIAFRMLSDDGFGIVEINESLGAETSAVFTDVGFNRVEILRDFSERNRFVYFAR